MTPAVSIRLMKFNRPHAWQFPTFTFWIYVIGSIRSCAPVCCRDNCIKSSAYLVLYIYSQVQNKALKKGMVMWLLSAGHDTVADEPNGAATDRIRRVKSKPASWRTAVVGWSMLTIPELRDVSFPSSLNVPLLLCTWPAVCWSLALWSEVCWLPFSCW